ncbi:MAG: 2-oxo acid dehydrogenase subunit E2 [Intrasporangium sp.]|uniref:2-oxo acid dehydrogenase subunit E2 n=1 Tax=Intrasporangium sp. TaxID=1925024 RepID=UPI0026480260|nr:2-oxo acid dehydrogenase subunit E2 [Intrasporangium sp.]MDN5795694.1 2-oxo acid dehydrogenase subunit E2 [Intrasporangium sp.]
MQGVSAYETRPFLKVRRAYTDILTASRRKDIIHGLFEIDVTEPRRVVQARRAAGEDISFTAFVLHAVARAVDENKVLHAYRRRNRLILFHDVDVNTQIEAEVAGQRIVQSLVVRAANRRSVEDLTHEIRSAQGSDVESERRYRRTLTFLSLPRALRTLAWRVVLDEPRLFKKLGGTVALSSIGMFGPTGGWGIPVGPATLMITVGGVACRPAYVEGRLEERQLLAVTVSVDHAIVDGAAAGRFARRLAELIESASGLAESG